MPVLAKDFQDLLATPSLPDLGPGPRPGAKSVAEVNKSLDGILSAKRHPVANEQLIRALLLLWHDHLDAAHTLAQEIEGSDGAFVHGIMHRREPDFGNAAYWFRRVGKHQAFPEIAARAGSLDALKANPKIHSALLPASGWDAFAFIHLCEQYLRSSDTARGLLQQIQAIETEGLLDYLSRSN